tara:strand:- start:24728 stop:25030 length:303 start_codon:yes stop_codon:yes gene_type:complete
MTVTAGVAIYLIVWWLVFFAALPFGVTSQHEAGGAEGEGRDPGAPVKPMIVRKMVITTFVAAIFWGGIYYLAVKQPIGFDDIPFMPKFHDWNAPSDVPQE